MYAQHPFIIKTNMNIFLFLCFLSYIVSFATSENEERFVKKTVIDSKLRFIHPVGIEGSGHHYILSVQKHLFDNYDLEHIHAYGFVDQKSYYVPWSMGKNVQHYSDRMEISRSQMHNLREVGKTLDSATVVAMDTAESFPFGFGPDKALNYMDLRTMAEIAEEKGVDLRIIYLKRSAEECVITNTTRRKFQSTLHGSVNEKHNENNFMEYMQILLADISIMQSLLEEIDPKFIVCHDSARIGEVEQSSKISEFVAPNLEVARFYNESLMDVANSHPRSLVKRHLLYENDDVVKRLQRKLDSFEYKYCK